MSTHAWPGFSIVELHGDGTKLAAQVSLGNEHLPPLLLLHGFPQSHLMWRKVAPRLAEAFRVVAPDLRGYGDSGKPPPGEDFSAYAKRSMAADLVRAMDGLGHARFGVAGHDRGGRVARRLALDHPARVTRLMLLDIAPTLAMYEQTGMEFARRYWWWFFLIQPAPLPEKLIAGEPELFLRRKIGAGPAGTSPFDGAWEEYLRHVSSPETLHAMCNDYRAAAGIDLVHDREDRSAGRLLACPVRAIWSATGAVGQCFDPLAEWRAATAPAEPVSGEAWNCGHYIAEERPDDLIRDMCGFFKEEVAA